MFPKEHGQYPINLKLKLKGQTTNVYLGSKNCNWAAQIQAETQKVSQLQGEDKGFLWEKEKK